MTNTLRGARSKVGGLKANSSCAPSSLTDAIRHSIRCEQAHEERAEKLVRVDAVNGRVRIPRTNTLVQTDHPWLLLAGTDDFVFKTFIEGLLTKLFKHVANGTESACVDTVIRTQPYGPKLPGYRLTRIGKEIITCCRSYDANWSTAYASHVFSPTITVMLRAMRNYAQRIGKHAAGGEACTCSEVLVGLLRRFVRFVRRVRKCWPFVNAIKAYDRQAQDNFSSARDFIYYMAGKRSRLLIIRVDLYFQPYHKPEQAREAIINFLRWLRGEACKRNLLPGYLGFIVKQENGLIRGTHWHLMVFCDGHVHCKGAYLAEQLGEMWAKHTGQGPGSYNNCFSNPLKYFYDALGILEFDDVRKMIGLRLAIHYMTKQQCVLKASNDRVKVFWRSPIPRSSRGKSGRPRQHRTSLAILKRMLGGKRSKYPEGFDPQYSLRRLQGATVQQGDHNAAAALP